MLIQLKSDSSMQTPIMDKVRILMVDDTSANLISLEALLAADDRILDSAISGNEALKMVLKNDYALILLDVNMPDMSGYEVATYLKANKKTNQIPIIFVTANRQDSQHEVKGYSEGAIDYLFKPLNPAIIKAKVFSYITMYRQRKALEHQNESLQFLKAKLERSNADLREFAYIVSHDLKEPLRTINNVMQFLEMDYQDQLDDMGKEYIQFAIGGVRRLNSLIDDILKYATVDAKPPMKDEVDLDFVLMQVQNGLKLKIDENKVKIIIQKLLPTIKGDESQLMQVFQNLIANAIKFRRENPTITISCKTKAKFHEFGINDNGIGIAKEYQERIFKIFKRVHAKGKYEGTGIGLSICKKIIERHGGKIWLSSEEGKGTTFYFSIAR